MRQRFRVPGGRTYTGYSIGCAIAWALVLLVRARRGSPDQNRALWLYCAGWWSGWLSATIARRVYPPAGSPQAPRARTAGS
jgi:hypothetical protein